MKKIGLLLAAFCAGGSFLMPQSASALTLNPGNSALVDFVLPNSTSYQSLDLTVTSLNGSLFVNFLDGLSGNSTTFNAPGGDFVINASGTGGTIFATITYTGTGSGTFDTSASLWLTAWTGLNGPNGTSTSFAPVPDAATFTPIPASLPLFLTGAGFIYGLSRRRKTARA